MTEQNQAPEQQSTPPALPPEFAELLNSFKEEIRSEMQNGITGAAGRIKREMESSMSSQLTEALTPILTSLTPNNGEQQASKEDPAITPTTPEGNDLSSQLAKVQAQIKATQEQNQKLQADLRRAEESRLAAEQQQVRSQAEQRFYAAASEVVSHPDQFLMIVQSIPGVAYQDGEFLFNSQDAYGNPVSQKLIEVLPDLVKTPSFAHFAKPRPGVGTGTLPASQQAPVNSQSNGYFSNGGQGLMQLGNPNAVIKALQERAKTD
jgi:hypothetical protein